MENEDTTTRRNPDSTLGIYLTSVKVEQYRKVDENRIEKEDKKGNIKEDSHNKGSSTTQAIWRLL